MQRTEAALFWIDCSMKKEHSFPQAASDQAPGGGESNREKCCPSPTGFLGFLSWNHSKMTIIVSMTNGTHGRDWQDIVFIGGASNLPVLSGDPTGELQTDSHNS